MRLIWRVLVGLFAWVGLLVVLLVVGVGVLVTYLGELDFQPSALPERIVLTADWRKAVPATSRPDRLSEFSLRPPATLAQLVLALDRAGRDPRVAGLVVVLDESEQGLAATQELRGAVQRFRAAGKFAIAWADSFGELAPANQGYYLATAFDEIWLQPTGLVGVTGLAIEQPFVATLLERFGVSVDVIRRAEYKSALESVSAAEMSGPNREMLTAVVEGLNRQLASGLAEGRKLEPAKAAELLLNGPYSAREAVERGLIDGVLYLDQLDARVRERAAGAKDVQLRSYASRTAAPVDPAAAVALIEADGLIGRGEREGFGLQIAADELAQTITAAAQDTRTDALLLRLSSRGGSPAGSETVAHAIRRAIASGKPVIVTMGDVAASGGYWVAVAGSRILAQPATLTGSIGVISAKPDLTGLWRELEVNWATVGPGGHSSMWSVNRPFTAKERKRLDALLGEVYGDFKDRVGVARNLTPERVEELARGRVWTGEDAAAAGLVDRVGGLHEALAEARVALRLPADTTLEVLRFPQSRWPFEHLTALLDSDLIGTRILSGLLQALGLAPAIPAAVAPSFELR